MSRTVNPPPETGSIPPAPRVSRGAGISMVWLIPLVTALIGGWLIYKTLSDQGPKIQVSFATAEGIEAGKTRVKYKEIDIGVVDAVGFSRDFSRVILTVSMDKGTESFLGRGARFWVVKPRLSLRGASGLGTLLSGAHIEIEPGRGEYQTRFQGLDAPPAVKAEVPGTRVVLVTDNLRSIDRGSPIYYQGIPAGEVMGWELGSDRKSIFIHAFVKAPYDTLVNSRTRFWDTSGVDLSLDANGIFLRTESLAALLYGGIAFETPGPLEGVAEDVQGLVFTLFKEHAHIQDAAFTKKQVCVLFFSGSVRGLRPGAPVTLNGMKVGAVKSLRLEYDSQASRFRIPVMVELEPERFALAQGSDPPLAALAGLIRAGLRARLKTGSLLTGQRYVDLAMHPGTPARLAGKTGGVPEIPTLPGDLAEITAGAKQIITRIKALDLEHMGAELMAALRFARQAAKGADQLVNHPDMEGVVGDFKAALAALKQMLGKMNRQVDPMADNFNQTLNTAQKALESTRATQGLVNQALDPSAPLQYRFIELASELSEMARSIRILVDMLERTPNAVIFGKSGPKGDR